MTYGATIAPVRDERFAAVRTDIEAMVDDGTLVSAAIGVVENGKIVWAEAFGDADREAGRQATIDTPYGVASMGKALTATSVMTLTDSDKLNLDDSIAPILGPNAIKLYAGDRAPTIRELLNMTSGVPHGALTYINAPAPNESDILDDQSIVTFPAGQVLHYSNFSMALAERVIEKVSGESYNKYMHRSLFSPLGMSNTIIGANAPAAAVRYSTSGTKFGALTPYPVSSRQINASLTDLLKFAAFQLKAPLAGGANILSGESIDALQNDRSGVKGAHIALGLGRFDLSDGTRWIISSGNDMGVQSSMTLLPERGLGVVFLSNSDGYQADEIGIRVADAIAPGFLDQAIAVIGAFEARTTSFASQTEWIGKWSGAIHTVQGERPIMMSISATGDVNITFDGVNAAPANEISYRDGMLSGVFEGVLPLREKPGGAHRIEFNLVRDEGDLTGFALANFRNARGKFEIPAPMRLKRQ